MTLADAPGATPEIQGPLPWEMVPWPYLVAGVAAIVILFVLTSTVRRTFPGARRKPFLPLRWRAKLRLHPGPGWAGGWERWRALGLPAARSVARTTRPSLSWWDRHRPGGWPEYATHIGRAWGWVIRRRVVATGEDVVLTIAGPRRGKSAASAARIIDAPGKVLATSIRDDALKHTIGPRSERGRIFIWNPEGLGAYGSNMRWNPVCGCEDVQVAIRRAGYMVESQTRQGLSDAQFWSDLATVTLAGLLHAAALANYSMVDVYRWSLGTDDTPIRILRQAKHANSAQRDDVENFLEAMPERTRGSVATTLRNTLQFMRDPEIAEMVSPAPDAEGLFDVADFVTSTGKDTLYLVSAGDDGTTAPLFSALIAEMAYTIRYGAAGAGGRLDPPLDMELDEVANIAPIPVHLWVSWMGGCGIRMRIYAQTWSQLVDKYRGLAESLWACASIKVIYGGTSEEALLKKINGLAGTVLVRGKDQVNWSYQDGERVKVKTPTYTDMPVLPTSEMRLPRHWAVVFPSDVPPVLVSTPKAWQRRDVRRWRNRVPEGIVAPQQREVPTVDPGLRRRLEQEVRGEEQVRSTQQEETVTETPVEAPRPESVPDVEAEQTPPEKSRALRDFVRRTAPQQKPEPKPESEQVPSNEVPIERTRDRARDREVRRARPTGERGTPPPLRRPGSPKAQDRSERLHPAPWELQRSEPEPPTPAETDDDLRGARLPWDEE